MQNALNYYNDHARAESTGMAVDWRKVANTMANLLAAELNAAQLQQAPATPTPLPDPPA